MYFIEIKQCTPPSLHPQCLREEQEKCLPHHLKPFEDNRIHPSLPHGSKTDQVTSPIRWKLIFTTVRSTLKKKKNSPGKTSRKFPPKCTLYPNCFIFHLWALLHKPASVINVSSSVSPHFTKYGKIREAGP